MAAVGEPALRVESERVFSPAEARIYPVLVVMWVAANITFWCWWFMPERAGAPWLYVPFTLAWGYEAAFLPSVYLFFVGRMRRPRHVAAPSGLRVALITVCVPAQETLDVITTQLQAMVCVAYPHDSWVLDEGNDPPVKAAAESLGVRYFSRKDVAAYNQAGPPFKANTKAGNVNAWLDAYGWQYDFFAQLDIDHRPRSNYLERVLGYFQDPAVAWVQAPSLYSNLDEWVARGAAEQELVLQGPLQLGFFGHSETPFIIGSHCTYRTGAIMDIGGFQPTRAEDHLDTLMLAQRGQRGVFVPEPIALGSGPETFETYLRQQFAWAVSMMQVLGGYSPRVLRTMPLPKALQFLFAQTWYPLWSMSMLTLFVTPIVALLTGAGPANAPMLESVVMTAVLALPALVIWLWTRRWQLPAGLGLSWRGVVLHIARWPIVLWALVNVLLRVRHPYMITPKGVRNGLPQFRLRTQMIYFVGFAFSLGAAVVHIATGRHVGTDGYVLFALLGAGYMLLVVGVNVLADLSTLSHLHVGFWRTTRLRALPLLSMTLAIASYAFTTSVAGPDIVAAARWTNQPQPVAADAGADRAFEVLASAAAESVTSEPPSVTTGAAEDSVTTGAAEVSAPTLNDHFVVGAYDPWQLLGGVPLGLEHWYVPQDRPDLLAGALANAGNQHNVMVTVEPTPRSDQSMPVLERVVSGQADDELRQLAHVVRDSAPRTVLIRWAHEMDLTLLYPWSGTDPSLYRAAFRHVVEVFRSEGADNARWVWSPAGEARALDFYPGDDVVDYVGLTVLGDARWDAELGFEPRQTMADVLGPRYARFTALGKPIMIAELGVSGSSAEQDAWLLAAASDLHDFPQVRLVVYYNDTNAPNNWRGSQPDWRLTDGAALLPLVRAYSG